MSIKLESIKSIRYVHSYSKQPALTFERLQINDQLCISPKNKVKFLEIINERCTDAKIDIY